MATVREIMGSLAAALEKEVVAVEERSLQVEKKREELEEEKRMMSSLPQGTDAANEIIEINVGGEIFCTKRATLLSADGSLLAAMFSGRWEDALDRDKDGRVFFDFDPAHFRIVLNHLRRCRITQPEKTRPPQEKLEHEDLFNAMVEFFGMREFLYGQTQSTCEAAALDCTQVGPQDSGIRITGHTISADAESVHPTVVGRAPLVSLGGGGGSAEWKVSVTRLSPGAGFFAGIIGNLSPGDNSFRDATSYGWSSGGNAWAAGQVLSQSGPILQRGDCCTFRLDVVGKRLRMRLERTGQVYETPLQDGVTSQAHLHLILDNPGTELVVSAATAAEVSRAGL